MQYTWLQIEDITDGKSGNALQGVLLLPSLNTNTELLVDVAWEMEITDTISATTFHVCWHPAFPIPPPLPPTEKTEAKLKLQGENVPFSLRHIDHYHLFNGCFISQFRIWVKKIQQHLILSSILHLTSLFLCLFLLIFIAFTAHQSVSLNVLLTLSSFDSLLPIIYLPTQAFLAVV